MAFMTALLLSAVAVAEPDQLASLQVLGATTSSKDFDLRALEAKIRNTDAMDVFSKINLKYEISSLIDDVARSQASDSAADMGKQRARFEKLIDSTVVMLRKGDVALAAEIEGSREVLWKYLNDPEKRIMIAELNNDGQND